MNLERQLRRPALRVAVPAVLLGGIVTSVVAAYHGYQGLGPAPGNAAPGLAVDRPASAAPLALGRVPTAATVGAPAAPAGPPPAGAPGSGRATPGWTPMPAGLPTPGVAGPAWSPWPTGERGPGVGLRPAVWQPVPALPLERARGPVGPGGAAGKACGMGFG